MIKSPFFSLKVSRNASEFGFYVLFPIFFFYHLGVTSGDIPGVFSGLFGLTTVVLSGIFVIYSRPLLTTFGKVGINEIRLFFLLIIYCLIFGLIQHFAVNRRYNDEAAIQVLTLLFAWFALFILGATLPFDRTRFYRTLVLFSILIGAVVLMLFDRDTLMFYPRYLYENEDALASYQDYARTFLVIELYLLSRCNGFWIRLGVGAIGAGILFLLGARSELFGLLALGAVLVMVGACASPLRFITIGVGVLVATFLLLNNLDLLLSSRQLQVIDLDSASSWIVRKQYQNVAIAQISANPFLGVYAGHFEAGGKGTYSHNALSAWVEFGFTGFALFLAMAFFCTAVCIRKRILEHRGQSIWAFALYVNLVSTFLLMISKPVFWSLPAFGWGLVINARIRERLREKKIYQSE